MMSSELEHEGIAMTAEKPPLSNQSESSREAVANRLANLDEYGKLELFSTCTNCAKWQEILFADNAHCIQSGMEFRKCADTRTELVNRLITLLIQEGTER